MSKEYSLPPVGLFKAPGTGIVLSSLTAPLSATPSLPSGPPPHAVFPTGSRTAVTTTAKAVDKNCGVSNPPSQVVNLKFFDVDIDFLPSEPPHVAQRYHPLLMGIVLEVVLLFPKWPGTTNFVGRPFGRGNTSAFTPLSRQCGAMRGVYHRAGPPGPAGACHRAGQRPDPVGRPDGRLRPDPVAYCALLQAQTKWAANGAETPGLTACGESCRRRGRAASSAGDPKETSDQSGAIHSIPASIRLALPLHRDLPPSVRVAPE